MPKVSFRPIIVVVVSKQFLCYLYCPVDQRLVKRFPSIKGTTPTFFFRGYLLSLLYSSILICFGDSTLIHNI